MFAAGVALCCVLPSLVIVAETNCNLGPGPIGVLSLKISQSHLEHIVICVNSTEELFIYSYPTIIKPHGLCFSQTEDDEGVALRLDIPERTGGGPPPIYNCHSGACAGSTFECEISYKPKARGGCQGHQAKTLLILAAVVLAWLLM